MRFSRNHAPPGGAREFFTKKRSILGLIAVIAVGAIAFGAYAYFTSTGTGNGNAVVGSSSTIALSSADVSTLYPGGADVPVTVNLHNPGSGTEYVGTISGTVETQAGCLSSWFQVDPVAYNAELAHGASDTAPDEHPHAERSLESGRVPGPDDGHRLVEQLARPDCGGAASAAPPLLQLAHQPTDTERDRRDRI